VRPSWFRHQELNGLIMPDAEGLFNLVLAERLLQALGLIS
jgi:hypothetical protein